MIEFFFGWLLGASTIVVVMASAAPRRVSPRDAVVTPGARTLQGRELVAAFELEEIRTGTARPGARR